MGLRGIAACWIVLGHYKIGEYSDAAWFQAAISHYYLAVDLFLVLSGFVLAMTYERRFSGPGAKGAFRRFLLHRLARIYPLYAITTLTCLALLWFGFEVWGDPDRGPAGIAANMLMVQAWWGPYDSFNGPAWSISTEWLANLLFALFVALLLQAPGRRAALVAGAAAALLVGLAFFLGPTPGEKMSAGQIGWYVPPYSLIRCTTEFMLGIYCWRLRARAGWTRVFGGTAVLLGLLAAVLTAALVVSVPALDTLFVLGCCGLILGLSFERSPVAAALGWAVPAWLGTISFSLYLWHAPLLPLRQALQDGLTKGGAARPQAVATAIALAAILAVSSLSYYAVENPSRRWLRRVLTPG